MSHEVEGLVARESKRFSGDDTDTVIHNTLHFNQRASLAAAMIEKWGMVAAIPDGESADGRQKLRLATPQELVDRAVGVTNLAFDEFRKRAWLLDVPVPSESGEDE